MNIKKTAGKITRGILLLILIMVLLNACNKSEESELNEVISENAVRVVPISADYPLYKSEKDCVDKADIVFSGTIKSMSFEMLDIKESRGKDPLTGLENASPIPYTLYTIEVDDIYKGKVDGETIVIKCVGGKSEEALYQSEYMDKMKEDASYLFLVITYDNSYPSPINPEQGVIELAEENNDFAKKIIEVCES